MQKDNNPVLYYEVLDKGFVKLIDFIGGDERAVLSARVSFDMTLKGEEKDKKLIEYLLKHEHFTPFEHCVFQFHIKCPIFVARQWMRHRWGCMDGKVKLYFDLPGYKTKGKRNVYSMSVQEVYEKWHFGAKPITPYLKPINLDLIDDMHLYSVGELSHLSGLSMSQIRNQIRAKKIEGYKIKTRFGNIWQITGRNFKEYCQHRRPSGIRMPLKEKLQKMWLRCLNEETKEIEYTHIKDVWATGIKNVFKITLENGYSTTITEDHRLLTEEGWKTLKDATDLKFINNKVYWSKQPILFVNGSPLYRSKEWLNEKKKANWSVLQIANAAGISYHTVRKWLKKYGLQFKNNEKGYKIGHTPWNKGIHYRVNRILTEKSLSAIRKARSGTRSNFWKGGVTSERKSIARWTKEQAKKIHAKNNYTCQICNKQNGNLMVHHIIPVWASRELSRNLDNLTTLCVNCHRSIHAQNKEMEFANAYFNNSLNDFFQTLKIKHKPKPPKTFLRVVPVKLVNIEYAGCVPTYDIEVEGPHHNFIADGIVVHNSYNEVSARYTEVKDEFYMPENFRIQDTKNKQGSLETENLDDKKLLTLYAKSIEESYRVYQELLKEGVAREMARMVLPVSQYTQFYWTINARSLLNFIKLRTNSHAQFEIREYAGAISKIFAAKMPWTWEYFNKIYASKKI